MGYNTGIPQQRDAGATIGVDSLQKKVTLRGKEVTINLWDTAGQERFNAVVHSMFKRVVGAVIVYDVTDKTSFETCKKWLQTLREKAPEAAGVLAGNKADMEESKRQVTFDEGSKYAQEHN